MAVGRFTVGGPLRLFGALRALGALAALRAVWGFGSWGLRSPVRSGTGRFRSGRAGFGPEGMRS